MVTSCRPNLRRNQTATVVIKKKIAKELLRKRSLKIGWRWCRVKIRVNIIRCYKCPDFGHYTRDYKGTDNINICLKCAGKNHKAKDCKNESYCPKCKRKEHRPDQTRRPYFRQLLKENSTVEVRRWHAIEVSKTNQKQKNKLNGYKGVTSKCRKSLCSTRSTLRYSSLKKCRYSCCRRTK